MVDRDDAGSPEIKTGMTDTAAQTGPRLRSDSVPVLWPFVRHAGWLSFAAGVIFLIAQTVMWTFDQTTNLETSQNPVFIAAKIVFLAGFVVLMFALIAVHGLQAEQARGLGIGAFSVAIVGTMMLAGDLWFETFAVPWLAGGPAPESLTAKPSAIFALGAVASYFLFAAGWTSFSIASVRARVFPLPISIVLILGGIAGWWALLAPGGIPLGIALTMLGIWIVIRTNRVVSVGGRYSNHRR
jgi:hypothetical protein